ncbi:MAG: hypothetical protein HY905_17065 [Deltaproteobacteria bacterium]|nr:hypothetical protein [Deltaproteobacteria bacterium]
MRKAFVARRAIEFRLGLDLEMERGRHTFVESPQEWINDIFRIAEVGDPTAPGTGTGVDLDLVDYVDRLRLYVESYPFDHPFTDGLDVAVISLRDDVVRAEPLCGVAADPDNRVRWSEDLARTPAWQATEPIDSGAVIQPWAEDPPRVEGSYHDPVLCEGQWRYQYVATDDAAAGQSYTFSVWVAPATTTDQQFGIGLWFLGEENVGPVWRPLPAASGWQRVELTVDRPGGGGGYVVPIVAALRVSDSTPFAFYAWGAQLERGDHAATYHPTMDSTMVFERDDRVDCSVDLDPTGHFLAAHPPTDWEGDVFRTAFSVVCADGTGPTPVPEALARECTIEWLANGLVKCAGDDGPREIGDLLCAGAHPDGRPYGGVAYYELPFSFHQAAIAEGDLFAEESFATGNYNYRIDRLALNVVGTNVRNCALSEYPAGCYARAVTPYSLAEGGGVSVRNYRGSDVPFTMPAAWVHDAKALAAERVITTPITSSDQALLTDLYRSEFRGRPVEGSYSLQIEQTDALDFDALEDIQFILYYRYWSASTMSKSARGGAPSDAGE